MARLNTVGDEESHRNNEIRSTWRRLLADNDDFIYDGQVEINLQIDQRLHNEQASRSKGEILNTLLEEQMQSLARSELFVLCIMSIASKLNLEIQVLKIVMETDVRSCVAKAQSRRLLLSDHAERFLDRYWPGWGSIEESGNPNREHFQIIVEELAKLCKLGISKEDAEVRLNAQTYKRRTAKLPGVPNTSVLFLRDIRAVIADITGAPLTTWKKKAKGKKDTTYHRPSHYPKTDGPPQLQRLDSDQHPAVPSTNDNEASPRMPDLNEPSDAASTDSYDADPVAPGSRQQAGTSAPHQSIGLSPAFADDTATEIEVGGSEWIYLSDSQSYGIGSGDMASPSPEGHSSPVTGYKAIQSKSHRGLKRRALDSPVLNKRRRADEPRIHEQAWSTLCDNKRLTGSFVNDILQHYIVDRPEVYHVDSSELAKWDICSSWHRYGYKLRPEDPPRSARRLKAQAARKFMLPFHHPLLEHWTLWVALHDKDSGAWIFEHYDSLPQKLSSDYPNGFIEMQDVLRHYLGWLLQAPIVTVTAKERKCALQADTVSCGIYLIANAIAIAQDSEVPQSIDPQLLRRELQGLQRKPAVEVVFNRDPSDESLHNTSPLDRPSDSTDARRSGSLGLVAPPPGEPFTDPTSNKSNSRQQPLKMPQTHLLQAETALQISNTDLTASRKTLEDIQAQVEEAEILHRKYSQQAAEALVKQETADRNIEILHNLEELPDANENDPSRTDITDILARYCRSAERAKADKAEYEDRAQAALAKLRAFDKPLEDANKQIVSQAKAVCKAEKYVEYLRRFSGSGADG